MRWRASMIRASRRRVSTGNHIALSQKAPTRQGLTQNLSPCCQRNEEFLATCLQTLLPTGSYRGVMPDEILRRRSKRPGAGKPEVPDDTSDTICAVDGRVFSRPCAHLGLKEACCVLCRHTVRSGETVAAVLGNARTKSLGGYSLSFRLPSLDRKFTHQTIHERHRTSLWRLCRGCLGTEDTFLYHADCFHAVERRYGRRLGIEDLWTIGLWTQGLPRMPAVSTARPQMMARMDVDTEAGTTDADSWLCGIGRLPQELLDQIYDLCPESLLWRYSSALGRMPLLEPLLDRNGDTVRQSLGDLGSWNRWGVTEATSGPSKFVRLSIDDLGIRAVEQLPATPSEPITQGAGVWYTVEPVGSFKDYQCEAKGGFLRLIPPGDSQRTDTGMTLWDTPSPPPTERIAWFSNRCGTSRICCVNLQGLRGLTAFCSKGAIYAIRPHYKWGITPALAPSQGNLPPSERKKLTPIYFPLANGETITEVWVRDCSCPASLCRKTVHNEALAIVTSTGRFQLFGRYISPLRGADNPHLGLRWRRIGDATTTHLLYTDTMFQTPHTDLGAASSMDRTLPPQKQPGPPAILTECRGWAIAAHFGYMSVASLRRVTQLKLFQNKWPGVVPTEIPCRGMLLGYEDGSLAALGDCSGYEAAAAEQQVEEDVFHDPWALHHRTIPGTGRVVLRCGSLTDSKEPDLDYRYDWDYVPMEGELRWWFDDHRTLFLRHLP